MRITLRWKITAILVLVGLVPAAIVGWFAYNANDDYRNKQILLVAEDGRIDQLSHCRRSCSKTPRLPKQALPERRACRITSEVRSRIRSRQELSNSTAELGPGLYRQLRRQGCGVEAGRHRDSSLMSRTRRSTIGTWTW